VQINGNDDCGVESMNVWQTNRIVSVCCLAVLAAFSSSAQDSPADLRERIDKAVDLVKPALVRIQVVTTDFGEGREQKFQASGSGAIITKDGFVVTNHHVAARSTLITCTLASKEELDADLIGTDALTDIAVIKLRNPDGRVFPTAEWADSNGIRVGDHVLAMGSPMALSQSVTLGIVSNAEMIMPKFFGRDSQFELDGEDVGSIVRWIGHDADIYGGNSGGPLVNIDGKIIGINEISMALSGAIPSNVARESAEKLMKDGKVKRSWLGVTVQPRLKSQKKSKGVLVSGTISDSPAAKAGIKSGDMLVRLGERDIDIEFDEQLPEFNLYVADLPIGQPVEATVMRDGQEIKLPMTTAEREEAQPQEFELKRWGITMRNISLMAAKEMKRDNRDGILVTSVRPGGPAGEAKPNIENKDVIVKVGDTPVKNVDELVKVTDDITAGHEEPVPTVVEFERGEESFLTVVKIGIKEIEDSGREVAKAWLPAATQVITRDIAEKLGKTDLRGFRVTRVYPGREAETAGLKVGDLIVAVDDTPLEANAPEDYEELPKIIRQYKIGTETKLKVLRGTEEVAISLALPASPKLSREMKKYKDKVFEFTARDITYMDKARQEWSEDTSGVLIDEIQPGGWAAVAHVDVGDLLQEAGGQKIDSVDHLKDVMAEFAKTKPESVVLKILHGIHTMYIEIECDWKSKG
jgi:serine protease Do